AKALRRDVLAANAYAARMAAGAVLFQLREYADQVLQQAAKPELVALLQQPGDDCVLLDRPAVGVDSVTMQDATGRSPAHWPQPPQGYCQKSYAWRDYFRGAMEIGPMGRQRGVYVARLFASEVNNKLKLSISAPVFA